MDDLLDDYRDQFTEHNWAHHIISNINAFHSPQSNVNLVLKTGVKKDPLKTVITFLKNKFSEKYPKAIEVFSNKQNLTKIEMADQIVKFVLLSIPHICLKCSKVYVPYTQASLEDAVKCFMCEIPAHTDCFPPIVINEDTGIVYMCSHCITLKGTVFLGQKDKLIDPQDPSDVESDSEPLTAAQKTPKKPSKESSTDSTSDQPKPPKKKAKNIRKKSKTKSLQNQNSNSSGNTTDVSEDDDEKMKAKSSQKKAIKKKGKKLTQNPKESSSSEESSDESEEENKKVRPICKFFENSRCKHGISGKECKFRHKKVCRRFMNYGKHKQHGCNKGRHCDYFHPKMCWESLNNQSCSREKCKFNHIKGTQRKSADQEPQSKTERPTAWQSSPPTANKIVTNPEVNSESFLEIANKLSQQISQMQIQQNVMMSRFTSLGLDQIPHPFANLAAPQHPNMLHQNVNLQPTAPLQHQLATRPQNPQ